MRSVTIKLLILLSMFSVLAASCQSATRPEGPSNQDIQPQEGGVTPNSESAASSSGVQEPAPRLVSEVELSPADLERISGSFGIELASGMNSHLDVDGAEVRLNHLVPLNERDLIPLFNALFSAIGNTNAVLLARDRVYEMISSDPHAAELLRGALELGPLQDVKLTPHSAFGEAMLVRDDVVVGSSLNRVAANLGTDIGGLINQEVLIGDETVRVNFILPGANSSAIELMDALVYLKGSEEGLYVFEDAVIEVVTDDWEIAETVRRLVTIPPPSPTGVNRFNVRFSVIPVSGADYMDLNTCSILASEGATERELLEQDPSLRLGGSLPFFLNKGWTRLEWNPEGELEMIDDSIAVGRVDIDQSRDELAAVDVVLTAEVGRLIGQAPEELAPYLEETEFWPVGAGSEAVQDALEEALDGMTGEGSFALATALAIWVNGNITYSDGYVGSRWGVETVLEQGYGRCWDMSDLFITLARSAGLPARQVDGWVYGLGGHIWSQVWLEDENVWLDVDTTAEGFRTDSFYVPIWGTRDGEMLFIYRDWPELERLGD